MPHIDIREIPKPSREPSLAIGVAELVLTELRGESSPEPARLLSELNYLESLVTVAATQGDYKVLATASMRARQFASDEAMVTGVVTIPKERKSGLGRRVVGFLEEIAREKGVKKLRLTSTPTATGFYEKLGYKKLHNYNDGSLDFVKTL